MNKRELPPSPPPPKPERHSWDIAPIADALGAASEPRLDPLHGKGARLRLGELPTLDLELFPRAHVVRLSTADLSLNLVQETAPTFASEGVIFEAPQRVLSITPSGDVLLRLGRLKPTETVPEPVNGAEESMTQHVDRKGLLDDSMTFGMDSDQAAGVPNEAEQETRIHLAGRLGTEVRYRTTRNDKLIAAFPIAVTPR